jgi:hypothetical protein
VRFIPVPAGDLDAWLPKIGWHLESFAENGQWTAADFAEQVRNRDRQLWIAEENGVKAVCLSSVSEDRLKTVHVTHCAGEDYGTWAHFILLIAGWAREIGAQRFEVTARPGWERVLRQFGLQKTHVMLEMRL